MSNYSPSASPGFRGDISPTIPRRRSASAASDSEASIGNASDTGAQKAAKRKPVQESEDDNEDMEPRKKRKRDRNDRGTDALEDIHKIGSDGKPLALLIGVVKEAPQFSAYVKKKRTGSLLFYMALADKKILGSSKNQLGIQDVEFSTNTSEITRRSRHKLAPNFLAPLSCVWGKVNPWLRTQTYFVLILNSSSCRCKR